MTFMYVTSSSLCQMNIILQYSTQIIRYVLDHNMRLELNGSGTTVLRYPRRRKNVMKYFHTHRLRAFARADPPNRLAISLQQLSAHLHIVAMCPELKLEASKRDRE